MCVIEAQPKVPSPVPTLRRTISRPALNQILRGRFPYGEIHLSDDEFNLCDILDIEAFLDVDQTNHIKYVKQAYDCDDFARRLWGQFAVPAWAHYAVGLLWTDLHAMVMCVDANGDVWLIEPQTDERRSDLLDWQGTMMRFVII